MKRIFIIFILFGLILNTFGQSNIKKDYVYANDSLYINNLNFTSWLLDSAGAALGAINGLTKTGNNIGLKGTLSEDTDVQGASYDLDLGTSSNRLDEFNIYSSTGQINATGSLTLISNGVTWVYDGTYFRNATDTLSTLSEVRDLLDNLDESIIQPFTLNYSYLEDFTDQRPGSGDFSTNSSTASSINRFNLDDFDNIYGVSTSSMLQLSDSGSIITLINNLNPTVRAFYRVVSFSDESGYTKLNVNYISDQDGISISEDDVYSIMLTPNDNTGGGGGGGTTDSLYHKDTEAWLSNGDTIPPADSVRNILIATDTLKTPFITDESGTNNSYIKATDDSLVMHHSGGQYVEMSTDYHKIGANWDGDIIYIDHGSDRYEFVADTLRADGSGGSTANSALFKNFIGDSISTRAASLDTLSMEGGKIIGIGNGKELIQSTSFDSIHFTPITKTGHREGSFYLNEDTKGLMLDDGVNGRWNIGSELGEYVYNNTGVLIPDGTIVRQTGSVLYNGYRYTTIDLAGNLSFDSVLVLGCTTMDIPISDIGRATFLGRINGLNTVGLSGEVYLGHEGTIIDDTPDLPSISVILGYVPFADAVDGYLNFNPRTPEYNPSPILSLGFGGANVEITNPGQNSPALITNGTNDLWSVTENEGFNIVADSVQVLVSGNYIIIPVNSGYGDDGSDVNWRFSAYINGVEQTPQERGTTTSTLAGNISYPSATFINAGDWVSLQVVNESNGTDNITVVSGKWIMEYTHR